MYCLHKSCHLLLWPTSATVSSGPTYKGRVWFTLCSVVKVVIWLHTLIRYFIHMNELDVNFIGIDTKCSCDLLPTSDVVKCLSLWNIMINLETGRQSGARHKRACLPITKMPYPTSTFELQYSRVKTLLPGSGNGWLKCCAIVHF